MKTPNQVKSVCWCRGFSIIIHIFEFNGFKQSKSSGTAYTYSDCTCSDLDRNNYKLRECWVRYPRIGRRRLSPPPPSPPPYPSQWRNGEHRVSRPVISHHSTILTVRGFWSQTFPLLTVSSCCSVPCHIVHLSSASALPILREARSNGAPLTVETTHHYLSLTAEGVPDGATQFKCCPPIRTAANQVNTCNISNR